MALTLIAKTRLRRHRGSVYIAVLGASMIVVTLAVGGILAAQANRRSGETGNDVASARNAAVAGLELARLWIGQDASWRTTRTNGNWVTGLDVGSGTVSIDVVDAVDTSLTNRPYDPVTVTATAQSGQGRHILQQTLVASATPLPLLQNPLYLAGDVKLKGSTRLVLGNNSAYIAGNVKMDAGTALEGNLSCLTYDIDGKVFGAITSGAAAKTLPASTVAESYASLGTLISPGNTIDKQVIGPGINPWGTANADGVYVIRTSSNLTIRNTRIYGTLVVICPGVKVVIDQQVLIQPYRSDYPALIINGDADLSYSSATSLSEATTSVNYNPTGAPYLGVADVDKTDTYPSEIQGLVHITGKITVSAPGVIRGALICEKTGSKAIEVDTTNWQIVYTPSLFTAPPQFYTTSVKMTPLAGSIKQVVN